MTSHRPVITIDGPAGSGKSTTARLLAERLGFAYLDTGAMYRAAALLADRFGTNLKDEGEIEAMLAKFDLRIDGQRLFVGSEDITDALRTPRIDTLVTPVSAHPAIRRHMVAHQRKLAANGRVVLEGRDTGTVVFPDADVKCYLDASLTDRAMRRLRQRSDGLSSELLHAEQYELDRRDRADSEREHSPLRIAEDAIVIDTSNLTIQEQVEKLYQICREKLLLSSPSGEVSIERSEIDGEG